MRWEQLYCCFGLDLGIAALIVSYLNLVESILLILISTNVIKVYVEPDEDDEYGDEEIEYTDLQWVVYWFSVKDAIFFTCISILLLIGLKKHMRLLIKIFLFGILVGIPFVLVDLIIEIYQLSLDPIPLETPGKLIVYLFNLAFSIFSFLVIGCYFLQTRGNLTPNLYLDTGYASGNSLKSSPSGTPTHPVPSPSSRIQHFDFSPAVSEVTELSGPDTPE